MSPQELAMHLTENAEILFAEEFEVIPGGSMTDTSKRRMSDPPAAVQGVHASCQPHQQDARAFDLMCSRIVCPRGLTALPAGANAFWKWAAMQRMS